MSPLRLVAIQSIRERCTGTTAVSPLAMRTLPSGLRVERAVQEPDGEGRGVGDAQRSGPGDDLVDRDLRQLLDGDGDRTGHQVAVVARVVGERVGAGPGPRLGVD